MWMVIFLVAAVGATRPEKCLTEPGHPDCGPNEHYETCPQQCPVQNCSSLWTKFPCEPTPGCYPSCRCNDGYLRDETGKCVTIYKCQGKPEPCGKNEKQVDCKIVCPPQSCESLYTSYLCANAEPQVCEVGCDCIDGYLRNDKGTCIPSDKCPPRKPIKCGPNEKRVKCKQLCPPQSCAISYTTYLCDEPLPCEPGCDCIENYLRNDDRVCVLNDKCPPPPFNNDNSTVRPDPSSTTPTPCNSTKSYPQKCGPNEIEVSCKTICPPQSCNISCTDYACNYPIPCIPGCDCIKNYLRDSNGVCILNDLCTECSTVDNSSPTVEENTPPRTKPVKQTSSTSTTSSQSFSSANSKKQLSSSESSATGQSSSSVTSKKRSANSQSLASSQSYSLADSKKQSSDVESSSSSQASSISNSNSQSTSGSQPDKHCSTSVPPTQCGVNETYAECSVGCPPYTSCPTSDTRAIVACSMPYPCPPGCVCKSNYRRKSYEDSTCILAEECPPVNCTRPNEVWNPCASSCFRNEFCPDSNEPSTVCNDVGHNCQPKCVCKDGFLRNNYDQCVSLSECPPIVDVTSSPVSNEQCSCANETYVNCDARCPDDYCPENDGRGIIACDPPYPCPPGCRCKLNYKRRSYEDDTCILAEECPPIPCTRPNEVWNTCPSGCLAETCFDVDNPPSVCNELVLNCQPKCVCMDGFYRNESDICVPASECPGKQCGANETYVWCNTGCPTDLCPVSDTRAIIDCAQPYPCPHGCRCKLNYLRKSYENYTCILAEECPLVNCTRPHEEWSSCPSPCLRENCEDVNDQPATCNYLVQNCQPTCICSNGYFRNQSNICIPASDCPPEAYGGN